MSVLRPLARIWTVLLGCTALALTVAVIARFLVPLTPLAAAPALLAVDPPDGATDVLPRTAITLRFSGPMNRASAEAALRIEPPTAGSLSWSPDGSALTFQPEGGLAPNLTYTVSLDDAALGRWWRPLAAPVAARFVTAPQPAVVAALPAGPGAPTDTALALVFSQTMVAPDAVGDTAAPPGLRLEPPTPATARWADQTTLVIFPEAPLAPATHYTATIGAGLTDLRGVELGAPFSWGFTTGWPAVVARTPAPGARWVSPRAPLSLRLAAPLSPDLLGQALRFSPPVEGDLAAEIVGASQVVTFTPRSGWSYGTTYRVELVEPAGSSLGPPPALPWQFSVGPEPRLVAFFPGQGQVLPPGEAIRLVFSTPMDEAALRAGLRIEPPVAELPVSVSESEVRLRPDLAPSTLYTITLAADTRDRSGEPLGAESVVRLRTAPARPALAAPAAVAGVLTLPLSRTAAIELEGTNLTALDLSLYPLDQATLLRALALRPNEWPTFSPERYGQALARGWRLPLAAPLDQPSRFSLPIGLADGEALASGAYYLRAVAPEGPRADLIVLATDARLTMRQGPGYVLVWATDTAGAPLADLPVALYSGGAALARGLTGPDGAWSQTLDQSAAETLLLAASDGGPPALTRSDWQIGAQAEREPLARSLLFPDQERYNPGDRVQVRGLFRRLGADGALALPGGETACRLQLRNTGGTTLGQSAGCRVEPATGVISGSLELGPDLAVGEYILAALVGDESMALPLTVATSEAPQFSLNAAPAGPNELLMRVSRGGLPLAGAVISWTLRLEPLAPPTPPDPFSLTSAAPAEPLTLSGQAPADSDGRVTIDLPADAAAVASSFTLRASLPGDEPGDRGVEGIFSTGATMVAVELPSRIVASDRRSTVGLLALDGLGRPRPGAQVDVEVFRAGSRDAPVLVRRAVAGSDGRAEVQLVQLRPGEYEVVATSDGAATTLPLWVYGARFSGWRTEPGRLTLVADKARYSPGEVASLLVATPETTGSLLLTVERGGLLGYEVRPVRAGQVITVPIGADMAPGVTVGAIVTGGEQRRAGAATLAVASPQQPLAVQVEPAQLEALPGTSLPLTITTTTAGAPVAADLLVTLAPDQSLEPGASATSASAAALARFTPAPPRASTVADLAPAGATLGPSATGAQEPRALPPGHAVTLEASGGAPGLAGGQIALPTAPGRWRITAYATSGADRIAAGSAVITTSIPLDYDLVAPELLRPGDRATVSLLLRNGSMVTRTVTVELAAEGLSLSPPAAGAWRVTLGPGGTRGLSWSAEAAPGAATARLRLTVDTPGLREGLVRELAIMGAAPAATTGATVVGAGDLATSLDLTERGEGDLTIAVAPGLRAALGDQAAALAELDAPSVEERAALALLAGGLARGVPGAEGEAWAQLARTALDGLDEAQNEDGGWGWWPDAPSSPFVTAFALEAQAVARAALDDGRPPSLRAIAYLGRAVQGAGAEAPAVDSDTRAYIAYALARAGRSATWAPELSEAPLGPDGRAYLALALPAGQSGALLDRLQAEAERAPARPGEFAPVSWAAEGVAGLPRGRTAVTAAAAQALRARRASAPELPGAETALLSAWGVDGWPTAFEAARVAATLLDGAPAVGGGPTLVRLDDSAILGDGTALSATVRASLSTAGLPARPALSVEAQSAATYLVAYSLPAAGAPVADRLSLLEELVDPASGGPLDPGSVRAGQLVGLRLTAVVARPLLRAELEVPLPAGLAIVASAPRAPFQHIGPVDGGVVRIGAANLQPGVYTQLILARAVAAGSFGAPPARLLVPGEPEEVAVAPAGVAVTIGE